MTRRREQEAVGGEEEGEQGGEEVFITAIFSEFLSPPPDNISRTPPALAVPPRPRAHSAHSTVL